MTAKQIRVDIRKLLADLNRRPPFDRPLRLGDSEQAHVLAVLNGDELFCPNCWGTFANPSWLLGEACPRCGVGTILPGAKMVRGELCQEAAAC